LGDRLLNVFLITILQLIDLAFFAVKMNLVIVVVVVETQRAPPVTPNLLFICLFFFLHSSVYLGTIKPAAKSHFLSAFSRPSPQLHVSASFSDWSTAL